MEFNPKATAYPAGALTGTIAAPGDKSISHRAVIFSALAEGESVIEGLLESADVLATIGAMKSLGAAIKKGANQKWRVTGLGPGGARQPAAPLDFGNSGTGARLIMGVVAGAAITADFMGDLSLCGRPMGRVLIPLRLMGAEARGAAAQGKDDRLPLTLAGAGPPKAIAYRLPAPSAQVKSAILLAGLTAEGETCVIEPEATRDHTERMLGAFGVNVTKIAAPDGARRICLKGPAALSACALSVPGDPSSAAFPAVAALIVPGSEIVITNVLVNPLRMGLYQSLKEMGADIAFTRQRNARGEPVADLHVRAGALKGVRVPASRAPSMIDEYPILAVAAACAQGTTHLEGLGELRVKESDRLSAMAAGLEACGVRVEEGADNLTIHGCGGGAQVPGGAQISAHHDHRLAMSFLVMGMAARGSVTVDGADMIATSFPQFSALMMQLGADMRAEPQEVPR